MMNSITKKLVSCALCIALGVFVDYFVDGHMV